MTLAFDEEEVNEMGEPTHEDANTMLRLAELWFLGKLDDASAFTRSKDYRSTFAAFVKKYPPGTDQYRKVVGLCSWFETVGTLVKHGLLNQELLYDWLSVDSTWERVKGFALGMRKDAKVPALWENFELLAKAQPHRP